MVLHLQVIVELCSIAAVLDDLRAQDDRLTKQEANLLQSAAARLEVSVAVCVLNACRQANVPFCILQASSMPHASTHHQCKKWGCLLQGQPTQPKKSPAAECREAAQAVAQRVQQACSLVDAAMVQWAL
jgi:hypothetical protein